MGDGMGWSGQCQRMGGATPGLGNQLFKTLWWYSLCGEWGCCSDMSLAGAWWCSAEKDCPRKTDLVRAVLPCMGSRVRSTRNLKIHPEPTTPGRDWLLVKQPQNWGSAGSSKSPREQAPVQCSYCHLLLLPAGAVVNSYYVAYMHISFRPYDVVSRP